MKICGLVTEYNPFHNGHLYHLQEAKRITGADVVIAVMSGHFLQRGEPAMMDKWERASHAVRSGVDLVIELPTYYATSSAETFAFGAIALLEAMGVDMVCFGSESGDLDLLWQTAKVINDEPQAYGLALRSALDEGLGFHVARERAVKAVLGDQVAFSANNILGIEYLRALDRLKAKMTPVTIKRISNNYNDITITSSIASATSIRQLFTSRPVDWQLLKTVVPAPTYEGIYAYQKYTHLNDFHRLFTLTALREGAAGLSRIRDVNEGLENKVMDALTNVGGMEAFIECVKSKRYTRTRIQRLVTSVLLGVKTLDDPYDVSLLDYARVLAFNDNGAKAIRHIKKNTQVHMFTNLARDLKKYRKSNPLLELDILATGIYSQVNHSIDLRSDYVKKPTKVEI